MAQDADATTTCSSAVSTHVGVLWCRTKQMMIQIEEIRGLNWPIGSCNSVECCWRWSRWRCRAARPLVSTSIASSSPSGAFCLTSWTVLFSTNLQRRRSMARLQHYRGPFIAKQWSRLNHASPDVVRGCHWMLQWKCVDNFIPNFDGSEQNTYAPYPIVN